MNLEPYIHKDENTIKSENDSNFEYKLVGVVLHRGNANFGHYTSIINVNR